MQGEGSYLVRKGRLGVVALAGAFAFCLGALAPPAIAGPPIHPRNVALDVGALDHACGAAVDSEGDVYVSAAGESKVSVLDPVSHAVLKTITNPNEPCSLAVNSKGELFVSEKALGNVVRYKPTVYPFVGPPSYGSAEPIDSSGSAQGIAVDPSDDRLYVAEGDHVALYSASGSFEATLGEGDLHEATGVAAYTYKGTGTTHYLFVADPDGAEADKLQLFSAASVGALKLRKTIEGPQAGEGFDFGPAGAYLAVDPGNADSSGNCVSVAGQACTAGHLLVYDAGHNAVDEFETSGEFLDRIEDAGFADAKPTALAIDRSGGASDGRIYVSAGEAAGSKLLAFGPLATPSRPPLPDLSHALAGAEAVTVDSTGAVYALAGALIHVFDPSGKEIAVGPAGKGIEDHKSPIDIAVDSACNVYVVDRVEPFRFGEEVTYYSPTSCPPKSGTTYTRHEPPIVQKASFGGEPERIVVNPADDHLLVIGTENIESVTMEFDSAAHASKLLRIVNFNFGVHPQAIGVRRTSGEIYVGEQNSQAVSVVDPSGSERLVWIDGRGGPKGPLVVAPTIAVDQSNGHFVAFKSLLGAAREYDASGAFVAEFAFPPPQDFTTQEVGRPYDIAVDNGTSSPNRGNVYVAYDDPKKETPDVWAFGPLTYGEIPLALTGIADGVGGGNATLRGTVNPRGFDLTECQFEYILDDAFQQNVKDEKPAFEGAEAHACVETLEAIGKGSAPVPVHADLSGLNPEGRYHFRLVAANKYGKSPPEERDARLGPPEVVATANPLPILYDEATLRAKVDPWGLVTKYHFEYGTSETYGHSTATQELAASAPATDVEAAIVGLEGGTLYHFRVVAENEALSVSGPDQTFETRERRAMSSCENAEYRIGPSARLPDCRAYELVTPAETNGLPIGAALSINPGANFNNWLTPPRGAGAGESLSYFTFGTLPGFDGNGSLDSYRAQRDPGQHPETGWKSALFSPTYLQAVPDFSHPVSPQGVAADQFYSFFAIEPVEMLPGTLEKGVYLRTPSGFEPVGLGTLGTDLEAQSRYVSPGGAHVIFSSKAHLDPATPLSVDNTVAIYDRAAGASNATVVSLKPDGSPFDAGENATYIASTEDGSAILFKVNGALYLRRGGQTSEVAEGPNAFAGISEDGRRVFYAATGSATPEGNPKPAPIYACDTQAGPCVGEGELPGRIEIASEAVFLNVSADGSHAFFSSEKALSGEEENDTGEKAVAEAHNLYAWDVETATPHFVSKLDSQDFVSFARLTGGLDKSVTLDAWSRTIVSAQGIGRANAPTRSTPGGKVFVFQSHARLSAYDNGGHGEIYRYDPAAAAGQRLLCVSCHPSGEPARFDAMLAATIGGISPTTLITNVTDGGEAIFFQSLDRLVPEDANDAVDVYEWQGKDAGTCRRALGCLSLISSGQGEGGSFLYSMSADGNDVFFLTPEKLVGADVAGSPSIYDARIEGGISDPVERAPCQGDSCQGNGSSSPALPAATTSGPGEEPSPRCAKGRHRVKGRCVKRRHKPRHSQRADHKRRAER